MDFGSGCDGDTAWGCTIQESLFIVFGATFYTNPDGWSIECLAVGHLE